MKENERSRLQPYHLSLPSKNNFASPFSFNHQRQTTKATLGSSAHQLNDVSHTRLSYDLPVKKVDYLSQPKSSLLATPQYSTQKKPSAPQFGHQLVSFKDQIRISTQTKPKSFNSSSMQFERPVTLEGSGKRSDTVIQNSGSSIHNYSLYDSEFGKKILDRTKFSSKVGSSNTKGVRMASEQKPYKRGPKQDSTSLIKLQIQNILSNPRYGNGIKNTLRQARKLVDTQASLPKNIPSSIGNHKKTLSVSATGYESNRLRKKLSSPSRPMSHQNYFEKSRISPRKAPETREDSQVSPVLELNSKGKAFNTFQGAMEKKCLLPDLDDSSASLKKIEEKIPERMSAIVAREVNPSNEKNLLTMQSATVAPTNSNDQISLLPFSVEDDEEPVLKGLSMPLIDQKPAESNKTKEETETAVMTGSKSGFGGFSEAMNRGTKVARDGDVGMRNRAKKTEFTFISQERCEPASEQKVIDVDSINNDFAHLKENPKNTLSEDINKLAGDGNVARSSQKNQKENLFSNYLIKKFDNKKFEISSDDEFVEGQEGQSHAEFDENSKIFDAQMSESIKNQKLKRTFSDDFSSSPKVRTEYGIHPEMTGNKSPTRDPGNSPVHDGPRLNISTIRTHYEKFPKKQILLDPKYKPSDNIFTIKPKEMITLGKGMFIPLDELEDEANKKFECVKRWEDELNKQEVRSKIGCKSVQFQFTEEDKRIIQKEGGGKNKMQTSPKHADDKTSKNSKCEAKREVIVSKRSQEGVGDHDSDEENSGYMKGVSPTDSP
jgi:hypothetical protein